MCKSAVLDSIVGYHVENHQVHIHYYKPRGDSKEAWDNIDIVGFARHPDADEGQLPLPGLGASPRRSSSISCASSTSPSAAGERGIQRQLSMFFKSPYRVAGGDARARPLQAGAAPPRLGARQERQLKGASRRANGAEAARGARP